MPIPSIERRRIARQTMGLVALILTAYFASWVYSAVGDRRYLQRVYVNLADQYEIVAFGDSLIEGIGAKQSYGFVSLLSENLGIDIYNAGVRRMKTPDALEQVGDQVLAFSPSLVIISIGGNDAIRNIPEPTTRANLFALIETITNSGAHVLLLGVTDTFLRKDFVPIYDALEQYFEPSQLTIARDFYDAVHLKPKYLFDPLHPNDAGHALLADTIEPVVRDILADLNIRTPND